MLLLRAGTRFSCSLAIQASHAMMRKSSTALCLEAVDYMPKENTAFAYLHPPGLPATA